MDFTQISKRKYVLDALEKFEQYLTRYAARMLGGNQDRASDVVQFVFMKLCEQQIWRPDDQLKAWLFAVCRNRIIDEARKGKRMSSLSHGQLERTMSYSREPSQTVQEQEFLTALAEHIRALPESDREVVELWSHGLKHREIAEMVARKPGAVRVQLHRAIKQLKRQMASLESNRSAI